MDSKLKGLEIQNYRGIAHLQLADLGKINLFIGAGGVGKTSLLESIWLITGMTNAANMPRIEGLTRGHTYTSDASFSLPFFERNLKNNPTFSTSINGVVRRLEIRPIRDKNALLNAKSRTKPMSFRPPQNTFTSGLESDEDSRIEGIEFAFTEGEKSGESQIILVGKSKDNRGETHHNMQAFINHQHQDPYHCQIIFNPEPDKGSLVKVFQHQQEERLLEAIREVHPSLKSFALIDNNLHADMGFRQRIPINVLGNATRKLVHMFASMFVQQNNFVAVDEFENGLGCSSQTLAWKIVSELAAQRNVDVFLSTHSLAVLENVVRFLETEKYQSYRDMFRFHTLRFDPEKPKTLLTEVFHYSELKEFLKATSKVDELF